MSLSCLGQEAGVDCTERTSRGEKMLDDMIHLVKNLESNIILKR